MNKKGILFIGAIALTGSLIGYFFPFEWHWTPDQGIAIFIICFVTLWVLVDFILSVFGGWWRLAKVYRMKGLFDGRKMKFQGANVGLVSYSNCITIGADRDNLFLGVLFIFKIGHPNLLIPLPTIIGKETRFLFFKVVKLTFKEVQDINVFIMKKLADMIEKESDNSWKYERLKGESSQSISRKSKVIITLAVWLVIFCALVIGIGQFNMPRFWTVYQRGIRAEGIVIQKEPENHGAINYSYTVNGINYKDKFSLTGGGVPDFNNLKIGEKILIFYDPLHPEVSVMGYPKDLLINEIIPILLGGIMISMLFTFVFYKLMTSS